MKLTDYVIDFLVRNRIKYVFGLTGGAVVHLFDSIDRNPGIQPVFCHHEQAAALAAVSYARVRNDLGAAIVTTGPGGTNAITGVTAAWQDSIPCIFVSGQSRKEHTTHGKQLRQLGSQELDIVSIVEPITKYAVMVDTPEMIRYHLEKAVYVAKHGRPGPVWIDIPLNFQWASIEPELLHGYNLSEDERGLSQPNIYKSSCEKCRALLSEAKRPLLMAGYGVRLSHAHEAFKKFVEAVNIPFVSSWTASDMFGHDNPLYVGRMGIAGQRGANLAVQNCDLLVCVGSHLSIPLTGTMFDAFARDAKIVLVDIDMQELDYETVQVDLPIWCDAKIFLDEMIKMPPVIQKSTINSWYNKCVRYKTYNYMSGECDLKKEFVDNYVFIDTLSDVLNEDDIVVVDGGGTIVYISHQALKIKKGQRLVLSSGICAMGTSLPESVGACFANGMKRTICLVGDGSMQLNIQELQTIVYHNLPIKIFVMNNNGYLAIRHTQSGFLENNYIGSSKVGGLSLPDFKKVAAAYGLKTMKIMGHEQLKEKIESVLYKPGPILCEVMVDPNQQIIPRQGFVKNSDGTHTPLPLEDMYPFLDRKEFLENMVVSPLDVSIKD